MTRAYLAEGLRFACLSGLGIDRVPSLACGDASASLNGTGDVTVDEEEATVLVDGVGEFGTEIGSPPALNTI